jgi:hypothetical protein
VSDYFSATQPVTEAADQIISFDCFLDTRDETGEEYGLRVFYQKMIISIIIPLVLIVAAILFWLLLAAKRKSMKNFKSRLITTIIILLFFAHPNIVKTNFDSMK